MTASSLILHRVQPFCLTLPSTGMPSTSSHTELCVLMLHPMPDDISNNAADAAQKVAALQHHTPFPHLGLAQG